MLVPCRTVPFAAAPAVPTSALACGLPGGPASRNGGFVKTPGRGWCDEPDGSSRTGCRRRRHRRGRCRVECHLGHALQREVGGGAGLVDLVAGPAVDRRLVGHHRGGDRIGSDAGRDPVAERASGVAARARRVVAFKPVDFTGMSQTGQALVRETGCAGEYGMLPLGFLGGDQRRVIVALHAPANAAAAGGPATLERRHAGVEGLDQVVVEAVQGWPSARGCSGCSA